MLPYERLIERARVGDVAGVASLVGTIALDDVPHPQPGRPYGRRALYAGHDGEILLMRWRMGAVSAIHDHGGASGVVVALRGDLAEELIDLPTGEVRSCRLLPSGAALRVEADGFHVMRAPDGGVSLHVYTPRPRGMQIADPAARCIWHVDDGHGAWLPVEPSRVVGVAPWPA